MHIKVPTVVQAVGTMPKVIEEFVGRLNSGDTELSIARMKSPQGWAEPGQRPEFDEYSLVLSGVLCVQTDAEIIEVHASQAYHAKAGQWVRYSTPHAEGAEYIAVCMPAFAPWTVNRDHE